MLFQMVSAPDFPTTDQKTLVEEFQLQGEALDNKLTWQAGLYYEKSEPDGTYGSLNPSQISCDMSTVTSPNIADWRCNDILAAAGAFQASGGLQTTTPGDPDASGLNGITVGSGLHAPGGVTYNIAAFYNDFKDHQVQFGYLRSNGVGSTSILNAGASTIQGIEIDGTVQLTANFNITASYAYLDTEVDELDIPSPSEYPAGIQIFSGTSTAEDEPLSYTPENQLVLSANYLLPIDPELGDMGLTATYVYTDEMQAVSRDTSIYAVLPSYELVNASFNWRRVAGSAFDLSVFATNLLDEEYRTNITGNWTSGLEAGRVGVPRMYGARVRYNF